MTETLGGIKAAQPMAEIEVFGDFGVWTDVAVVTHLSSARQRA